ncbi:hypothetical protein RRG08_022504 [Elysia crispata]|uniref:Uncharacterized protein n=1 Tax=Elysia crispata TaxID=231223 RepID=A0AAE1D8X4_9GAST|nr:hypothetical protein RRG08_022504 [Elysia crispata]
MITPLVNSQVEMIRRFAPCSLHSTSQEHRETPQARPRPAHWFLTRGPRRLDTPLSLVQSEGSRYAIVEADYHLVTQPWAEPARLDDSVRRTGKLTVTADGDLVEDKTTPGSTRQQVEATRRISGHVWTHFQFVFFLSFYSINKHISYLDLTRNARVGGIQTDSDSELETDIHDSMVSVFPVARLPLRASTSGGRAGADITGRSTQ